MLVLLDFMSGWDSGSWGPTTKNDSPYNPFLVFLGGLIVGFVVGLLV